MGLNFWEGKLQEISWSELKLKKLSDIKQGECLRVTGDGQMAFYVVVNPQQAMKDRLEFICQTIDAGRK